LYALKAIELIAGSLRAAVFNGKDVIARTDMATGSLFAGISLANAGVGAVHALAYPVGGQFAISHGVSNALLLPYVMEFNVPGNLQKFAAVAQAMGESTTGKSLRDAALSAVKAVRELSIDIGIPQSLREVGIPESAIDELTSGAMQGTRLIENNPRRVRAEDVRAIFQKACS
ncbi:MAG: iron-containing alcohol dehydrogenase, partial [Actinobacteria bacterium]|nr:iron-containing alcohol dehydrogenase [Actinomycetota bacterium]